MKKQLVALFVAVALLCGAIYMTTLKRLAPSTVAKIEKNENVSANQTTHETVTEVFEIRPLDDALIQQMTGKSYHPEMDYMGILPQLRLLKVTYKTFDGENKHGEIIVNQLIAEDVLEVFKELYANQYPLQQVSLVDAYNGDDEASMNANNTSGFNMRTIAGTNMLSQHAFGLAVDINPLYNPQVINGVAYPSASSEYVDRTREFAGKISETDLVYRLFAERGFTWGGYWETPDYQHFERGY